MNKISRHIGYAVLVAAVLALGGCVSTKVANKAAEIEGHYAYEHSWSYDLDGWHISVHETGTMDFYDDGTALDYAVQVYEFTWLKSGCKAVLLFQSKPLACGGRRLLFLWNQRIFLYYSVDPCCRWGCVFNRQLFKQRRT